MCNGDTVTAIAATPTEKTTEPKGERMYVEVRTRLLNDKEAIAAGVSINEDYWRTPSGDLWDDRQLVKKGLFSPEEDSDDYDDDDYWIDD